MVAPAPIPQMAQAAHVRSVGVLVRVEYSSPMPVVTKMRARVMATPLRFSMSVPFWVAWGGFWWWCGVSGCVVCLRVRRGCRVRGGCVAIGRWCRCSIRRRCIGLVR